MRFAIKKCVCSAHQLSFPAPSVAGSDPVAQPAAVVAVADNDVSPPPPIVTDAQDVSLLLQRYQLALTRSADLLARLHAVCHDIETAAVSASEIFAVPDEFEEEMRKRGVALPSASADYCEFAVPQLKSDLNKVASQLALMSCNATIITYRRHWARCVQALKDEQERAEADKSAAVADGDR